MGQTQEYFDQVKQECIKDCGNHSLEEIAEGMFEKEEVVNLFLSLEETDEAYSTIIDLMQESFTKDNENRIYVPGCGTGGLARRIKKEFPKASFLQIDNSPAMIAANKKSSSLFVSNNLLTADVLNCFPEANSTDAIIAYGIMRYIPSDKRDKLIYSWASCLKKDGITIIGEGMAKDIVTKIPPRGYKSVKNIERSANLFRCTLFYLLCQKYNTDNTFRDTVLDNSSENGLNYAQVLRDIAGFTPSQVYAKLLIK